MDISMKRLFSLVLATVFFLLPLTVNADDIPKGFVGTFADAGGVQLELKSGSAQFRAGGASFKSDIDTIDSVKLFGKLLKGETKIYIERPAPAVNDLAVYWVMPDQKTKVQYGDVVYFKATVIFWRIPDRRTGQANAITVLRSEDAMVSLDTTTKRWQIGWSEKKTVYILNRVVKTGQ
jgi:hypothetical protein